MSESLYQPARPQTSARRNILAPNINGAFDEFSRAVCAEGALPENTKQLIAVAVAHVTRCPHPITGDTTWAQREGVDDPLEIKEAIWVAAEIRAGGAVAHLALAIHATDQIDAHAHTPVGDGVSS